MRGRTIAPAAAAARQRAPMRGARRSPIVEPAARRGRALATAVGRRQRRPRPPRARPPAGAGGGAAATMLARAPPRQRPPEAADRSQRRSSARRCRLEPAAAALTCAFTRPCARARAFALAFGRAAARASPCACGEASACAPPPPFSGCARPASPAATRAARPAHRGNNRGCSRARALLALRVARGRRAPASRRRRFLLFSRAAAVVSPRARAGRAARRRLGVGRVVALRARHRMALVAARGRTATSASAARARALLAGAPARGLGDVVDRPRIARTWLGVVHALKRAAGGAALGHGRARDGGRSRWRRAAIGRRVRRARAAAASDAGCCAPESSRASRTSGEPTEAALRRALHALPALRSVEYARGAEEDGRAGPIASASADARLGHPERARVSLVRRRHHNLRNPARSGMRRSRAPNASQSTPRAARVVGVAEARRPRRRWETRRGRRTSARRRGRQLVLTLVAELLGLRPVTQFSQSRARCLVGRRVGADRAKQAAGFAGSSSSSSSLGIVALALRRANDPLRRRSLAFIARASETSLEHVGRAGSMHDVAVTQSRSLDAAATRRAARARRPAEHEETPRPRARAGAWRSRAKIAPRAALRPPATRCRRTRMTTIPRTSAYATGLAASMADERGRRIEHVRTRARAARRRVLGGAHRGARRGRISRPRRPRSARSSRSRSRARARARLAQLCDRAADVRGTAEPRQATPPRSRRANAAGRDRGLAAPPPRRRRDATAPTARRRRARGHALGRRRANQRRRALEAGRLRRRRPLRPRPRRDRGPTPRRGRATRPPQKLTRITIADARLKLDDDDAVFCPDFFGRARRREVVARWLAARARRRRPNPRRPAHALAAAPHRLRRARRAAGARLAMGAPSARWRTGSRPVPRAARARARAGRGQPARRPPRPGAATSTARLNEPLPASCGSASRAGRCAPSPKEGEAAPTARPRAARPPAEAARAAATPPRRRRRRRERRGRGVRGVLHGQRQRRLERAALVRRLQRRRAPGVLRRALGAGGRMLLLRLVPRVDPERRGGRRGDAKLRAAAAGESRSASDGYLRCAAPCARCATARSAARPTAAGPCHVRALGGRGGRGVRVDRAHGVADISLAPRQATSRAPPPKARPLRAASPPPPPTTRRAPRTTAAAARRRIRRRSRRRAAPSAAAVECDDGGDAAAVAAAERREGAGCASERGFTIGCSHASCAVRFHPLVIVVLGLMVEARFDATLPMPLRSEGGRSTVAASASARAA